MSIEKRWVSVENLERTVQAIDLAVTRGAYQGSEIFQIGMLREKLVACLQNIEDGESLVTKQAVDAGLVRPNGEIELTDQETADFLKWTKSVAGKNATTITEVEIGPDEKPKKRH